MKKSFVVRGRGDRSYGRWTTRRAAVRAAFRLMEYGIHAYVERWPSLKRKC